MLQFFFILLSALAATSGFTREGLRKDNLQENGEQTARQQDVLPGLTAAGISDSLSAYPQAVGFELRDQHGVLRSCLFPSKKIRIITFADQKGTACIEGWLRPIYKRYRDQIDIKGVAVLAAVPVIARGLVSAIIKTQVEYPVLLDWDGLISEQYGYEKNTFRLVVVDREGGIRHRLTGRVNKAELQKLFVLVDALLQERPVITSTPK